MFKKISFVLCTCATQFAFAGSLNLSGNYLCSGHDSHDGNFTGSKLTLILDTKNSDLSADYTSYHYKVTTQDGSLYSGAAVGNGDQLAMYFANQSINAKSDHGISIGSVSTTKEQNGALQTKIHKFYYEPAYYGGGNGYEDCIKQ